MARDFDRQGGFTLGDFVSRLRADLTNPPREEQAATTEEDSPTIRLMSIHQAKGLEFPIVVIPDLNRQPNPRAALVGLHPVLGVVIRPPRQPSPPADDSAEPDQGNSVGWLTFQAIEEAEDRKESLRLFYVAATRARDHLILSAGLESEPETETGEHEAALFASLGSCRSLSAAQPRAGAPAFQLLLERFDWRSGSCVAPLPEGWPAPRVEVALTRPPEAEARRRRGSIRRQIQDIEEAIARTPLGTERTVPGSTFSPALIDLDPEQGDLARSARLNRLVRVALADRALLRGDGLEEVCARLGARQVPAANSRLASAAASFLRAWPGTSLFRELRDASRGKNALKQDVRWMISFPLAEGNSTVIRGHTDAIYRDRQGQWRPVIVSLGHEETETDRLLSMFAVTAAQRDGFDRVGPAWLVRPGRRGELRAELQLEASPAVMIEALRRWLEGREGIAGPDASVSGY
jgi:ATP-dependent helicase/nuclease subunit A